MPEPAKEYDLGVTPAVFLHEVDRTFHDLREAIELVAYVLYLHESLRDDLGPLPPERCGNAGWVLEQETKRFQEALNGWYRERRAARRAAGIPDPLEQLGQSDQSDAGA